ncbi:hypothetical protein LCGC14_2136220 [marine sediment metagenome]|uniref:Uncharacterized protein n=1 Tax=marine sediment metagenome TaxID=412755 RepID=A0A0F9GCZ7_9ZZZZ
MKRPAITRKGHQLLAKALRQSYRESDGSALGLMNVSHAVSAIANVLAKDNPHFDRDYFLAIVWGEANISGL